MSDMTDVPQEDEDNKRRGLALWTLSGTTALVLLIGGGVAFTGSQKTESGNPQSQQSIKPSTGASSKNGQPSTGSNQPSSPAAPGQPGPVTEPTQDPGAAGNDSGVTAGDTSATEQPGGNAPGSTPSATNSDTTSVGDPGRNPGDPTATATAPVGGGEVPGQDPSESGERPLGTPTPEPTTPEGGGSANPGGPGNPDNPGGPGNPDNPGGPGNPDNPDNPGDSEPPKFLNPKVEWVPATWPDGSPVVDVFGEPVYDMRLSYSVPTVQGTYYVTVRDGWGARQVKITVDKNGKARLADQLFINYPDRQLPKPDKDGLVVMDLSPFDFGDADWDAEPKVFFTGYSEVKGQDPVDVIADPPPVIPPKPQPTPTPTPTESVPPPSTDPDNPKDPAATASPSPTGSPSATTTPSASATPTASDSTPPAFAPRSKAPATSSPSATGSPTKAATPKAATTKAASPRVATQSAAPVATAGTTKAATTRATTVASQSATPKPVVTKKSATSTTTSDDPAPASPSTTQQRPLAVQGPRRARLVHKRVQTRS